MNRMFLKILFTSRNKKMSSIRMRKNSFGVGFSSTLLGQFFLALLVVLLELLEELSLRFPESNN